MLTDTQCRNAKPLTKPYKLTDGKGLYLEVKPNGVKAWRYRFKLPKDGKLTESTFAIGNYASAPTRETLEQVTARKEAGQLTVAEAREERAKARGLVKQGINPVRNRWLDRVKRGAETATTFRAVAGEWLDTKDWEEDTKRGLLRVLERVIFPKIGSLPVREISPAHILDLLKAAGKNNGLTVAAQAKRTMSGIFSHAVATLRADIDPVYPVRNALPANKTQHKRPLSEGELGDLLRDLKGYERNYQTVAAFQLMFLTLCRPSEVVGARWDEFDFDARVWTIASDRMKKRKAHRVPLPDQAIEVLTKMRAITGHRDFVFPNRDNRNAPMTDATLRQALKNLGWAGRFSPHATRTTGSTILNEMGYSADWIERQLAHAEPNAVRRTYNHADHLARRAEMMQEWANLLDSWALRKSTVTPIRSIAA